MGVYIVLFGVCLFLCLIGMVTKDRNSYSAFIVCIVIALFAGLRWNLWSDWANYYNYFMGRATPNDFEVGYVLLVKLARIITFGNYTVFLLFIYLFAGIVVVKTSKVIVENYESYVVLFYLATMIIPSGGQRTFIAECIYFLSLKYLSDGSSLRAIIRNNIKYFIIVILAAAFHRTAIIMIIIPFIAYIVRNIKIGYLVLMFVSAGFLNAINFFDLVFKFVIEKLSSILPSVSYRMLLYQYTLGDRKSILSPGALKHVIILVIMIMITKMSELYFEDETYRWECRKIFSIVLLGVLLSLILGGQYERIKTFCFACEGFAGALAIKGVSGNSANKAIITVFLVLLLFTGYLYTLQTFYPELLYPYEWCFGYKVK